MGRSLRPITGRAETYDVSEAEWYQKALAADGDIVFTDAYMDAITGRPVVTIEKRCGHSERVNIMAFDIFPENFQIAVNPQNLPVGGSYYLCDTKGTLLYAHTETEGSSREIQEYVKQLFGQIEAGEVHVGDTLTVLPGNETASVKSILVAGKEADTAQTGQPVTIQLDKEIDVSRGCVLENGSGITAAQKFTTTLLWMDDNNLSAGGDYFIKLGTKLITGTVTEISYKIDVNTGEHHPTDILGKNEIAVCSIVLDEKIPLDVFKKHKTMGELILIDRVTNMTSACGVVEQFASGNETEEPVFVYRDLKARGDIFEEFYYNMEKSLIAKHKPEQKTYTVGDEIPTKSETYEYPEYFDILILRDQAAVQVRDNKIEAILPLADYRYSGVPVVNGRGFAVNVKSQKDLQAFLDGYGQGETDTEFWNHWLTFGTYRKVIFHENYWEI